MASIKTLVKPQLFHKLLTLQKPSLSTQAPQLHEFVSGVDISVSQRKFSTTNLLAYLEEPVETFPESTQSSNVSNLKTKEKKPLDVLFKEVVGLSEKLEGKSETSEDEMIEDGSRRLGKMKELNELKKKLRKIEGEVRSIKGNLKDTKKKKSVKKEELVSPAESNVDGMCKKVVSLFSDEADVSKQEKDPSSVELKAMGEFSPEMILFVRHLHEKGYLNGANFLRGDELDFSCFSTIYSRGYLRCAAERLGKDHPEMAKYISESDVKRLALFGCPSIEKKTTSAAKRLRSYFNVHEDIVCRACKLNSSCASKYHTTGKKIDDMNLADVMKIVVLYGLELVPPELTIPDEIKDSVNKLLKQTAEYLGVQSCSESIKPVSSPKLSTLMKR